MRKKSYSRSRKYRYAIALMLQEGKTFEESEKEVFKRNLNKSKFLAYYKETGLFPYGEVDPPEKTTLNNNVVPEVYHTVAQESVVNLDDSVLTQRIKEVVTDALNNFEMRTISVLDAKIQVIDDKLNEYQPCSSSVAQLRPRLKRTTENCIPTSFRLPRELVSRVKEKSKTDPIGVTGLNGVVETLLFKYIGSPPDLLEE